jgi:hypothetical protein
MYPKTSAGNTRHITASTTFVAQTRRQQQQLKKLGILIYYLDQFNHNRSLHTPRARSQIASQSEPPERATLLPGLSPGYVWLCIHTTVVF